MNISTLELADNHILAEGAGHLVDMLKANFTIHTMVCSCLDLPLEGVHVQAIMCVLLGY